MKLTPEQLQAYDRDGFVVIKDLFSPEEVRALQEDADVLATPNRGHPDANVIEKDGVSLRAAWAPEIDSPACAAAYRLPRLLGMVKQIMGDNIYLYQSRLNYKRPLTGDVFQWHQDYQAWATDSVPRGGHKDILSVLIMLDDTYDMKVGPLQFLPGTHHLGVIPPFYDTETTSYALHMVDDHIMNHLQKGYETFTCMGPAGTVVIFAGNLVHGSTKNTSPHGRRNLYFAYNQLDNKPTGQSGRKHANNFIQNPTPEHLTFVSDDELKTYALKTYAEAM
jgi:ectoine hydroxylase